MKILAFAAHPDDEILGCGGTMLRHVSKGDDVDLAVLGEGITSRYDSPEEASEEEITQLQETTVEVASEIGINKVYQEQLPDNRFDSIDRLDVIKKVESIIEDSKPDIIYTHHAGDLNLDHRITSESVVTATRPGETSFTVRKIYSFEVLSSTEWNFVESDDVFAPNHFINIENQLDRKVDLVKQYDSEIRSFPHPRSEESIRALAKRRGSQAGFTSAEAFELIRSLRK